MTTVFNIYENVNFIVNMQKYLGPKFLQLGRVAVLQDAGKKMPSVVLYRMKFRSREASLGGLLLRERP